MTVKGSDGIIFIVERNSKEFVEVKDKRYENQNLGGRTMKYSIETTENGVNETLEVDGNLYKKSGREK